MTIVCNIAPYVPAQINLSDVSEMLTLFIIRVIYSRLHVPEDFHLQTRRLNNLKSQSPFLVKSNNEGFT
jgi:hypothetical protein